MAQEQLTINGIGNFICYAESMGLAKCFEAYAEIGEEIDCVGFNPNSGYTYIYLTNGITICSMLGQDVQYQVTDLNDYEETYFDTYEEALYLYNKPTR